MEPWAGTRAKGQLELVRDVGASVAAQLAGEPAPQVFRVEAGHGVGKTFIAACLVNWFFDSFPPSITITTAPTEAQVKDLLWKDVKTLRRGKNLPGRVLPEESRMVMADDWWAVGRTTSDSGGQGTARMQGQHPLHWLYVLDEAEGVPDFVFGAVDGMMTGGRVGLVLMLANPQTRTSPFHAKGREAGVANYRMSVLDHPNVVQGREVVPGATRREWAAGRIAAWCEVVSAHSEEDNTFTVPFAVATEGGIVHPPGTIFRPNAEFCFRVLGVAPANLADRAFVSSGVYEAALGRTDADPGDLSRGSVGVDVARFGRDAGTVYARHGSRVWRAGVVQRGEDAITAETIRSVDAFAYQEAVKRAAVELRDAGARRLSVRVDGTGGFGTGLVDLLRVDEDLRGWFEHVRIVEVNFSAKPHDVRAYADIATELYAEAGESLRGLRIESAPNHLEADLTGRPYEFVNRKGQTLKRLQEKEKFRKLHRRSPDDGDGFVLAVAPEYLFDHLGHYVHEDSGDARLPAGVAEIDVPPLDPGGFDSFRYPI